jgi:hypothetical protein
MGSHDSVLTAGQQAALQEFKPGKAKARPREYLANINFDL